MVPYLRVANVFENRIDLSDVKEMNFTPAEQEVYRLLPHDILLNEGQSPHLVGRPAMYRGEMAPCFFQNTLVRFRAGHGVLPGWALLVFRAQMHNRRYMKFATITTNIAHLGAGRFSKVEFPVPPLEVQEALVATLDMHESRLDAAVASLTRARANVKRARASVLKAAVEGRLVPTEAALARTEGRDYEPASALLARILDERRARHDAEQEGASRKKKYKEPAAPALAGAPTLPEGWVYCRIDAAGKVQLGRQRSPKNHQGPDMRPYLRVANVFEARIDLSDVMEMNFTPEEFKTFELHPGDILLNEGQSPHLVGRPAMWTGQRTGMCFTNSLVRFQAAPGVLPAFALTVFRAQLSARRYMKLVTITTNIAHLGAQRFAAVEFPLAPLAEQHRIVAEVDRQLSVLDATIDTNLARCARLRQSILKRAFEGGLAAPSSVTTSAEQDPPGGQPGSAQ